MKHWHKIIVVACLCVVTIASLGVYKPFSGNAQFVGDIGGINNDDFDIKVSPEFPQPFQEVTVSVSSFLTNVSLLNTTWFVNGVVVENGIGIKSIPVTVGASGTLTTVEVQIVLPDGTALKKVVRLIPGSVDILWQATDSYVPAFYKGKALPASEALVRIVAMPEGGQDAPLSYTWSHYRKRVPNSSGYQRTSFEARQHFFEEALDVGVEIYNRQGIAIAKRELSIPVFDTEPIIEIEDGSSSYRVTQTNAFAPGNSFAFFKIIPFFFSTDTGRDLAINWFPTASNGGLEPSGSMTWVSTNGIPQNLSVDIEHTQFLLQNNTIGF